MQRDPLGYSPAPNLLEYVQSRPTGLRDPSGQAPIGADKHLITKPGIKTPFVIYDDAFMGKNWYGWNSAVGRTLWAALQQIQDTLNHPAVIDNHNVNWLRESLSTRTEPVCIAGDDNADFFNDIWGWSSYTVKFPWVDRFEHEIYISLQEVKSDYSVVQLADTIVHELANDYVEEFGEGAEFDAAKNAYVNAFNVDIPG